jgi:hypothetical protein
MEEDIAEAVAVLEQRYGKDLAVLVIETVGARGCLLRHVAGVLSYEELKTCLTSLLATATRLYIPDADKDKLAIVRREVATLEACFYSAIVNNHYKEGE